MTYNHQQTYPKRRRAWPFIVGALVLGFCVVGGIAALGGTDPGRRVSTATDPTEDTAAATTKAAPKVKPAAPKAATVTAGTWTVGTEVKAGTYTTTADGPCYWARLKNFEGELDSIRANGNLSDGERGRLSVKASDKGLELSGDCVWIRAGS